jgi:hypothetical protein
MGLAPYGRPRFVDQLARLYSTDDRGGLRLQTVRAEVHPDFIGCCWRFMG